MAGKGEVVREVFLKELMVELDTEGWGGSIVVQKYSVAVKNDGNMGNMYEIMLCNVFYGL